MSREELIEPESQTSSSPTEQRDNYMTMTAARKATTLPQTSQQVTSSTNSNSSQEARTLMNIKQSQDKDITNSSTQNDKDISKLPPYASAEDNSSVTSTDANCTNSDDATQDSTSTKIRRLSGSQNQRSTKSFPRNNSQRQLPYTSGNNCNPIHTVTSVYPNGITAPMYEDMSHGLYHNPTFMPVASPYFTPQFFPPNGQYFYDPQYNRFPRPPQTPPTYVRSNVYSYPAMPMVPTLHLQQFQTPPPFLFHQQPARYHPVHSAAGGDSGFSSRRSSLDPNRTPEFGPQHSQRMQQKKPKQLDKALWVGNLPDTTTQEELKEFFADENMESVFLIKKSNCAFVNYKTHEAVDEAVQKYNECEFKGIKLVCRPRKQTAADIKAKTNPQINPSSENTLSRTPSETASTTSSSARSQRSSFPLRQNFRQSSIASMSPASSVSSTKQQSPNRYFILKSLTQDDLDISVQSGVWATQPHNEAALNKAYKTAENVFLIFSANKSGEFYGYARMASHINKEATESIQWTPIDEAALAASSSRPSPLPFTRTRHLRNPWNANREVKISRDGTEVEPVVGERLLAEFHRVPLTTPAQTSYGALPGPLLAQPLNIDNQHIENCQERKSSAQPGTITPIQTPITSMMDPSFIQTPQGAFFAPTYWPPQPILVPPYAGPAPTTYLTTAQSGWSTTANKDHPSTMNRAQPPVPTTVVGNATVMTPIMPIEQQYVEASTPPNHTTHYNNNNAVSHSHLQSTPATCSPFQQSSASPVHYYRSVDDSTVESLSYQTQRQSLDDDEVFDDNLKMEAISSSV
ncbi:3279_t:CDS:2 [Paraglomus brasilianum]|uniref:3279_t:CDS:1 n=1 Tax=Paraglomus brasilianum TaxID=144538 RepID=A0A9N9GYS6_9GLOM|nr:3279_t:CDS:2 [Paraglomus brasilianum]